MPKTVQQVKKDNLNKSGVLKALYNYLDFAQNKYAEGSKEKEKLFEILDLFRTLQSNDEETLQEGLEYIKTLNDFLHDPFNEEKSGYEIITGMMNEGQKEDFDYALKDFNDLFDAGIELNSLKGMTAGVEKVRQINFNEINTESAKDDVKLIKLEENSKNVEILWENVLPDKPDMSYNPEEILEYVEPRLKTNAQKNVLRVGLNAYMNADGDILNRERYDINNIFKNNVKSLINREIYPNTFINIVIKATNNAIENRNKDKQPHGCLDKILEYAEYKNQKSKEKAKNNTKAVKKSSKKNYEVSKETQDFTKRSEAPALNADTIEWFATLKNRAEHAKGNMNSDAYKKFFKCCEEMHEIIDIYDTMRKLGGVNSFGINDVAGSRQIKIFNENCDENGRLSKAKVEELYKNSWNKLQDSAAAYVEFKLDKEGFSRDPQKKPGRTLKTKSKEKFLLMDEVFGHAPRKAPQKDKQIQM